VGGINSAKDLGRSLVNKNVTCSINCVIFVVTNQVYESWDNISVSCAKRKYKEKILVVKFKIIKKVNKNEKTKTKISEAMTFHSQHV
jgi:hypothetical protein